MNVTRSQFRLLLLMMLIQLLMSAEALYAPGLHRLVGKQWVAYQQARAHRAEVRQNHVVLLNLLSFSQPPTQLVWDEDPSTAAALLKTGGYRVITVDSEPGFLGKYVEPTCLQIPPAPLHAPSILSEVQPSLVANQDNVATVFVHGRTPANGPERLVAVWITSKLTLLTGKAASRPEVSDSFDVYLYKSQTFCAQSFATRADQRLSAEEGPTELALQESDSGTQIPGRWKASGDPKEPGTLELNHVEALRVFAAQADGADPSHFTIAFDLDGVPGVIDGWLLSNGGVALEPRVGRRVGTVWFPHAK